jgi:hypothetical protein
MAVSTGFFFLEASWYFESSLSRHQLQVGIPVGASLRGYKEAQIEQGMGQIDPQKAVERLQRS